MVKAGETSAARLQSTMMELFWRTHAIRAKQHRQSGLVGARGIGVVGDGPSRGGAGRDEVARAADKRCARARGEGR